ncbi:DUF742 domain-containing protein [Amycolatopsis sp.]|uniref:DUF742 domain-containing protein n=1 Tax=Amycolatopsis sp. TaxID=37632 RepID=UPI002C7A5806|nr:DUF742 domain-containing protein [Amycolatopsis sp.]HVV10160.1 DUF742 domain-containing protein [Amycolatopsis sp.]
MTTGPGSGSSPPEDGDATFADVLNGFTLDSGRSRRKRKKARETEAETAAPAPKQDDAAEAAPSPQPRVPEPPPPPPARPEFEPNTGLFEPGQGSGLFEPAVSNSGPLRPEPGFGEDETAVVRPYALTGGRTKASYLLELETLISVQEGADARMHSGAAVSIEHHSIVEECRTPRSVAEVAALLRIPIGVARVLISDAADAGLVTVHKTVSGNDNAEAHLMLMERVLSGLRRL